MKTLFFFIFFVASITSVTVTTGNTENYEDLAPCTYEVFSWAFSLVDPLRSFTLVTIDAVVDQNDVLGDDFNVPIFIDYAEPNAASVGSGITLALLNGGGPGGALTQSVEIPRSCNLMAENQMFISVMNQGERAVSFNITVEIFALSDDDFEEIIMESFERTHAFTVSRVIRPDVYLDPYFFHKITFSDEFKDEISLVSSFTITIENRKSGTLPALLSYDHFPVDQLSCGDLSGVVDDTPDTFTFKFSACDIADVDSIYISLRITTDDRWAINIRPDASDEILTTTIQPNDPFTKGLARPATISNTQFFEVNTAEFSFTGKTMIVNVDNIAGDGSITLYQVTPSCRISNLLCEETSEGCKYVFEECELQRWRELGLNIFTFGLDTSTVNTMFTFSVDIVDVPVQQVSVEKYSPNEIADRVGFLETKHYELSISQASQFITCNHNFWLNIYVYVDSEDDFVSVYLNNGEYSSLGCGSTYRFCSVLDNDATSLVRGCGFQISSCELSEFVNTSWFVSVQGKRSDGTPAEAQFYRSDISYTLTATVFEPVILYSFPSIQTGVIENTFYSSQYIIPAAMISESKHLVVSVYAFPDAPLTVYIKGGHQAGLNDGCLEFDDDYTVAADSTTQIDITGCWSIDDRFQDADIYISIKGRDSAPLVKEFLLSVDYVDLGITELLEYQTYQKSILSGQTLNFTLPVGSAKRSLRMDFSPELSSDNYLIAIYPSSTAACAGIVGPINGGICTHHCSFVIDGCFDNTEELFITVYRDVGPNSEARSFVLNIAETEYKREGTSLIIGESKKFCTPGVSEKQFFQFKASPGSANLIVRVYYDSLIDGFQERSWTTELFYPDTETAIQDTFSCFGADETCTDSQECTFTLGNCELQSGNYILTVNHVDGFDNTYDINTCFTIEILESESFDFTPLQLREGRFGEFFGSEGRRISFQINNVSINDPNFRPITRLSIEVGSTGTPWSLQPHVFTKPIHDDIDSCSCDELLDNSYFCTNNPCVTEFHWCELEENFGLMNIFLQPKDGNINRIPYTVIADDFINSRFQTLSLDGKYTPIEITSLGYVYFSNPQVTDVIVLNFNLYETKIVIHSSQEGPATSVCGNQVSVCDASLVTDAFPFFQCRVVIQNCDGVEINWVSIEIQSYTRGSQIQIASSVETGFITSGVDESVSGLAIYDQIVYHEIELDASKFYEVHAFSQENGVDLLLRGGRFCSTGSTVVTTATVSNGTAFVSTFWVRPCDLLTGTNTYTFEINNVDIAAPSVGTSYGFEFIERSYPVVELDDGVPEIFDFDTFLVNPASYYQIYKFTSDPNTDDLWRSFTFGVSSVNVQVYMFTTEEDIGIDALSSSACAAASLPSGVFLSTPCCNPGGVHYFIVGGADSFYNVISTASINNEAKFLDTTISQTLSPDPSTGFFTNYRFRYEPSDNNQYLAIKMAATIPAADTINTYVNYGTPAGQNNCFNNIGGIAGVVTLARLAPNGVWKIFPCEGSVDIFLGYRTSDDAAVFDTINFEVIPYERLVDTTTNEVLAPQRDFTVFYYDIPTPDYGKYNLLDSLTVEYDILSVNVPITVYLSLDELNNAYVKPPFPTNVLPTCATDESTFVTSGSRTNSGGITFTEPISLCNTEESRLFFAIQGNDLTDVNLDIDISYTTAPQVLLSSGNNLIDGTSGDVSFVVDTEGETLTELSYIVLHVSDVVGSMAGVTFDLYEACNIIESCSSDECIFLIPPCNLVKDSRNVFFLQYNFGIPLTSFNIYYEIKEIPILTLLPGETVGELVTEDYIRIYKYAVTEPQSFTQINIDEWFNCNSDDVSTVITRGSYSTCRADVDNHLQYCATGNCGYSSNCEILSDDIYVTLFAGETRNSQNSPIIYRISSSSFTDASVSKTLAQGEAVNITLSDTRTFFRFDLGRSVQDTTMYYEIEINPEVVSFATLIINNVRADRCDIGIADMEIINLTPISPKYSNVQTYECRDGYQAFIYFDTISFFSSVELSETDQIIGRMTFTQPNHIVMASSGDFQDLSRRISSYPTAFPLDGAQTFDDTISYRFHWPSSALLHTLLENGTPVTIGSSYEKAVRQIYSKRFTAVYDLLNVSDLVGFEEISIETTSSGVSACLSGVDQTCSLSLNDISCTQHVYWNDLLLIGPNQMVTTINTLVRTSRNDETILVYDLDAIFESPSIILDETVCYEFSEDPTFFKLPGTEKIEAEQIYKFTVTPAAVLSQRMLQTGGSMDFELSSDYLSFGSTTFSNGALAGGSFEFTWRCPPTLHKLYDFFSMAVTVNNFPPFASFKYEIVDIEPIELTPGATIELASGYYKYVYGTAQTTSDFFIVYAEGTGDVHVSANVANHGCDSGLSCTMGPTCSVLVTQCNGLESGTTYYIHVDGVASLTIVDTSTKTPITASLDEAFPTTGFLPKSDSVEERIDIIEVNLPVDTNKFSMYQFTTTFPGAHGSVNTFYLYPVDDGSCAISNTQNLNGLTDCDTTGGKVIAIMIADAFTFCDGISYSFFAKETAFPNTEISNAYTEDFESEIIILERGISNWVSVSTPSNLQPFSVIEVYATSPDGTQLDVTGCGHPSFVCDPLAGFTYYYSISTDPSSPAALNVESTVYGRLSQRTRITDMITGTLSPIAFASEDNSFSNHYYFLYSPYSTILSISVEVTRGETVQVVVGDCEQEHYFDCSQYDETCIFEFRVRDNFYQIQYLNQNTKIYIDVYGVNSEYTVSVIKGHQHCRVPSSGEIQFCGSDNGRFSKTLYARNFVSQDKFASIHHEYLVDFFKRCENGVCREDSTDCDITDQCVEALKQFSCETALPLCDNFYDIEYPFLTTTSRNTCLSVEEACGKSFNDVTLYGFSCEMYFDVESGSITNMVSLAFLIVIFF